jgi:hypothetical protein
MITRDITLEDCILDLIDNSVDGAWRGAGSRPIGLAEEADLAITACKDELMQQTLANLALDFMKSVAADLARPGGFIPAFRVVYKDSVPMVTVGGVLPAKGAVRIASDVVNALNWPARPAKPITAPHLTMREATTLQCKLPSATKLTRNVVQELGFDLEEEQIEAFETYYRQYPAFAQIVS